MEDEISKHLVIVSTVPADGLAPLGARTSAGIVVIRCKRGLYLIPFYLFFEEVMTIAEQVIEWWIVCFSVPQHPALSWLVDFL